MPTEVFGPRSTIPISIEPCFGLIAAGLKLFTENVLRHGLRVQGSCNSCQRQGSSEHLTQARQANGHCKELSQHKDKRFCYSIKRTTHHVSTWKIFRQIEPGCLLKRREIRQGVDVSICTEQIVKSGHYHEETRVVGCSRADVSVVELQRRSSHAKV